MSLQQSEAYTGKIRVIDSDNVVSLQAVLPRLAPMINDTVPKVRLSAVELLLAVRNIQSLDKVDEVRGNQRDEETKETGKSRVAFCNRHWSY